MCNRMEMEWKWNGNRLEKNMTNQVEAKFNEMEWKWNGNELGSGMELVWKWNEDRNRQKICYRIEEKWNRNEIKSRVRFHAEENEAEI